MDKIIVRDECILLDICCQHLGTYVSWEGFCGPFGPRVWKLALFDIFFVLNWEKYASFKVFVGGMNIFDWIYTANIWEYMYVNWGVSVGPSHFLTFSLS